MRFLLTILLIFTLFNHSLMANAYDHNDTPETLTPFTLGFRANYFIDGAQIRRNAAFETQALFPHFDFGIFLDKYFLTFFGLTTNLMLTNYQGYNLAAQSVEALTLDLEFLFRLRLPLSHYVALSVGMGVMGGFTLFRSSTINASHLDAYPERGIPRIHWGLVGDINLEFYFLTNHMLFTGVKLKYNLSFIEWGGINGSYPIAIQLGYGYRF